MNMTAEQIVAITKFMNDHDGHVRLEEDEWKGAGVSTLKYIATDGSLRQLQILLGQRGAGILHFRAGAVLHDMC